MVYTVISRMFCPTVTTIKKNDHVAEAHVNGSCAKLSANASRSEVDMLSLNSRPYGLGRKNLSNRSNITRIYPFFLLSRGLPRASSQK